MSPESPLFTAQIPTPESQGTRWAALQGSSLTLGQGCVRPSTGKSVRQSVAFRPTGNALTRSSRAEGAEVWGPTYCGRSHQFASTWPKTESPPPRTDPLAVGWIIAGINAETHGLSVTKYRLGADRRLFLKHIPGPGWKRPQDSELDLRVCAWPGPREGHHGLQLSS